jgi:hypothetical protein
MFKSRKLLNGRYEYEVELGRWVSRQRVNQLRNKKAHSARKLCAQALSTGTLKRQPCEKCGKKNAQFHHFSYDDPYAIVWLCKEHHVHRRPHILSETPIDNTVRKRGPKGKRIPPIKRIQLARKSFLDTGLDICDAALSVSKDSIKKDHGESRYYYVHEHCRCTKCVLANREYQLKYLRKRVKAKITDCHGKLLK